MKKTSSPGRKSTAKAILEVSSAEETRPNLTPMLIQYLVGLCCLKWNPEAVDVTLGDMVLDPAAGKERDVDVTVTISEAGQPIHAFKAYEVKHEGKPLDVAVVEQLCIKLMDMPTVTHKGIVSASGFTEAAQKKSSQHGVDLYEIVPWTRPLEEQFPALAPMRGTVDECFSMSMTLLCWARRQFSVFARDAKGPFTVNDQDSVFTKDGKPHKKYRTFDLFKNELLLRSTEVLCTLEPATSVLNTFAIPFLLPDGTVPAGPAWPHTHSMDVSGDSVYVQTSDGISRLDVVTINGHLQWQRSLEKPQYYVIEHLPNREAFAGALIATGMREGSMNALVLSPNSRAISINFVQLLERQLNSIRRLKLAPPGITDQSIS